jgi:hypothetical protein
MRGDEFVDRVKRLAKERGMAFRFDPSRGKGNHGTVWLDGRFTVMPDPRKELLGLTAIVVRSSTADPREDCSMERFIADLVEAFDSGKMDRHELCQSVALAAVVHGAGSACRRESCYTRLQRP